MESCTKAGRWRLAAAQRASRHEVFFELAISATGRKWLRFPRTASRVHHLNFELAEFSIQHRISDICEAKGINIPRELCLWNLRGYATDRELLLARISRQASKEDFGLIVLDPLYNLSRVRDENASRDMADLMNAIECVAVETGAAVAFSSHYSKGNQAGKESMDRISGSGVFALIPIPS